jgi:hypothetical protein
MQQLVRRAREHERVAEHILDCRTEPTDCTGQPATPLRRVRTKVVALRIAELPRVSA